MTDIPLLTLIGEPWADYALLDSGGGRKLERYGARTFIRPEPQAMWAPHRATWDADGEFVPAPDADGGGRWFFNRPVPAAGWELGWNEARFMASCTPFRHLAFFPDMAPVWEWLRGQMAPLENPSFLNLFGYTGVGSQALASVGAGVTHVDASKKSVAQARANAELAGMADAPIRWIVDDASKFAGREVRRGKRYDAILLDPPKYGRGPDGERWELETDLAPLIADCAKLLDADSRALFLTVYAVRMSPLAIGELLRSALAGAKEQAKEQGGLGGTVECGELAVREEARGLLLPTAIWARWSP